MVVSDWQSGGRGRLGRSWQAPQGKSLAISVLLRPNVHHLQPDQYSWLPLLAGQAVCNALNVVATDLGVTEPPFVLKWPNDVLLNSGRFATFDEISPDSVTSVTAVTGFPELDEYNERNSGSRQQSPELSKSPSTSFTKISGVLSELQSDGSVILGAGINLLLASDELPVPTATSLNLALDALTEPSTAQRATPANLPTPADLFDAVAFEYLSELADLYSRLIAASGDAVNAGIRSEVAANLATLDQRVRIDLPGERQLTGIVHGLGALGELLLTDDDGHKHRIFAGDITHLRPVEPQ